MIAFGSSRWVTGLGLVMCVSTLKTGAKLTQKQQDASRPGADLLQAVEKRRQRRAILKPKRIKCQKVRGY